MPENQIIIMPEYNIVSSKAQEFKDEIMNKINDSIKSLTIDLTHVEMIDSSGLSVFVATHNSLKNSGGTLTVSNASNDIKKLFKVTRLDQHFAVSDS
jgi:anti-sigma B factor antagonist